MSTVTRRRAARTTNLVDFPADYPHPHRIQGTAFFCGAIGASRACFYNYLNRGLIPPPDVKLPRNGWRETTIADAVEALAAHSRAA